MILGICLCLSLAVPPEPPPVPPSDAAPLGLGDILYPIPILDDWDGEPGGGGSTVVSCVKSPGTEYDGTKYWIIVKTIKYPNVGTYTYTRGPYHNEAAANAAYEQICGKKNDAALALTRWVCADLFWGASCDSETVRPCRR